MRASARPRRARRSCDSVWVWRYAADICGDEPTDKAFKAGMNATSVCEDSGCESCFDGAYCPRCECIENFITYQQFTIWFTTH